MSGCTGAQRLKTVSGDIRADLGGPTVRGQDGERRHAPARQLEGGGHARGDGERDVVLDRGAGDIEATTVSGDLRLEIDPARGVRMRTTSGDLSFAGTLEPAATLEAETVSGDARTARCARKIRLRVRGASFSGDIENCFGKKAEKTSRHGPGSRLMASVGEGKARVRVKSMSGDVSRVRPLSSGKRTRTNIVQNGAAMRSTRGQKACVTVPRHARAAR